MAITRRDIIRGGIAAAACAAAPAVVRPVRADGPDTVRNLVILLAYGGWDTTWVLDPKPGSALVDTPEGAYARAGGIDYWSHATRPNVDAYFERWGDRTAVINGLQVRSFVHADCIKRVMTGSPSETTPDMGAIAAYELGRDLPVPYLALGSQARSGPLASITGRAGTTNQLTALVDPEAAYAAPYGLVPSPGFQPTADEDAFVKAYLVAGAERLRSTRGQRGANARKLDDFVRSLDRAERLARFAAEGTTLGAREYTVDLQVQIPLAVRAITEGLSHTALLQSPYPWDTHQDNMPQSGYHDGTYAALSTLMQELEDTALLDHTLVVVLSEMGRTPRLNGDRGKDHWPVTSCLLAGAGVAGSRVYGGTDERLNASAIDFATGEPIAEGNQLQAVNLVAGILEAVGVDPEPHLPGEEVFRAFRS